MTVALPALRPTHPLGYLAALGTLRLANQEAPGTQLAWTDAWTPAGELHTDLTETDLIELLATIWQRQATLGGALQTHIAEHGPQVLPPCQRLVPAKGPGLNDPAKMLALHEYPTYASVPDTEARRWLQAIGSDVVLDPERPSIAMSAFYLLSRQQRLDQQLNALLDVADEAPDLLHEAFRGWRRRPLQSGMNWDVRGNRNAAVSPTGQPDTRIVAGATWLAMMSLPLFPVGASKNKPTTRGWQAIGRRSVLLMPCWRPPLDVAAAEVLLDHPVIRLDQQDPNRLTTRQTTLDALGVKAVYACDILVRRVAGQTERYLTEGRRLAPAMPIGPAPANNR